MPLNQDPKTVQANTPINGNFTGRSDDSLSRGSIMKWVFSSLIPQRTSEFGPKAWTDVDVFSTQAPITPNIFENNREFIENNKRIARNTWTK